ncbi:lipoamide acyltransferase component of branched-chain alpha-keto acid dehydrogenase complex, mitochondrial-like isoform X2 [Clavelina lepadiformis]|uniref:lipoamide acyltransferase component of branched-chain alpha-keto acid dehydrogenase complex, mitochondrial-like isoform X2 n=1 Tax=Clavelina lepadiformis TaxID=159417 RepID=UPI004042773C
MNRGRIIKNIFARFKKPSYTNRTQSYCRLSTYSINGTKSYLFMNKSPCHSVQYVKRNFHSSHVCCTVVPFKLSDIGEGIKEVEVLEWFVAVGDEVSQFDNICEVQSDKAAVTITSRYDGTVKKLHHEVGDVAQVGDTLVDIEVADDEATTEKVPEKTVSETTVQDVQNVTEAPVQVVHDKALATPAVRRLAKEHNVSLSDIKATGKDGRVLKEDILLYIGQSGPSLTAPPTVPPPSTKVTPLAEDRIEPIKGIRKVMFTSMKESLSIPHFGYDDEFDLGQLVDLRYKLKKEVKHTTGLKLSYMPFIIKATSLALKEHPILNSQIDGDNLVFKADHNICIATDTPHGLLLPCIKQVQNLSILDITAELNRLHEAGLNNKISPADIAGGSFSLSNIGNIGGTYARPVIFPPQVAIGALGRIQVLPRFDYHGNVVKAHVMCISWSGDHRVIEGATMARFSNQLKDYLEEPAKMLMHLK